MLLALLAAGGLLLLFVPVPGPDSHRLLQAVWGQGHLALFCVLTLLLFRWRLTPERPLRQGLWQTLPWLLGLALATEGLQLLTPHRQVAWQDLVQNLLGVTLGMALSPALGQHLPPRWRNLGVALALPVLAWVLMPLWLILADTLYARQQFPQLLSLAQPTEQLRVRHSHGLSWRLAAPGEPGDHVLAVTLPVTGGGLALEYVHGDWRRCERLLLRLWAPSPMALQLRIHDQAHNWHYSDRFNRTLSLESGWQTLAVSLKDIARAPDQRVMALDQIRELALFHRDPPHELRFLLSEIRLSGEFCSKP